MAPLIVPTIDDFVQVKWEYTPTTDEQIQRAIKQMKPWKVTQLGTIPNAVFIHARDILVLVLGPIFRATDSLKIYPEDWKLTEMPILRKPGKPDYTSIGAWRPMVLSNGYTRLLNSCKMEDLVIMCEKTRILPSNHFRGRPGEQQ